MANGLEFKLETEATRFVSPDSSLPEGTRVLAYPTLRLPLTNAFGFLTPQIGWHSSYYALDDSAPKQPSPATCLSSASTAALPSIAHSILPVPITSRPWSRVPTMSTRRTATRTTFRYSIPHMLDFSYAQMFTENQFVGGDRINDANQLTLAVTSRFIEESSGLERLQVTLGQRYYFSAQQVTLPGVPARTSNATDLLAAVSGQITRDWRINTALAVRHPESAPPSARTWARPTDPVQAVP